MYAGVIPVNFRSTGTDRPFRNRMHVFESSRNRAATDAHSSGGLSCCPPCGGRSRFTSREPKSSKYPAGHSAAGVPECSPDCRASTTTRTSTSVSRIPVDSSRVNVPSAAVLAFAGNATTFLFYGADVVCEELSAEADSGKLKDAPRVWHSVSQELPHRPQSLHVVAHGLERRRHRNRQQ